MNALSGGIALRDDTLFVEHLALRTEETSLAVDGAVKHYLTTPILDLRVSSDKVSLPEIARVVPMLAGITDAAAVRGQGGRAPRSAGCRDGPAIVGGTADGTVRRRRHDAGAVGDG